MLARISEGMSTYSNQEKADMHFMYGLANGNALEAARLYRQRFPRRHVPDRKMFEKLHRCLCETGSFVSDMQDTGRSRSVRTPQVEDNILQRVEDRPDISTREVSRAVNVSQSIVWQVLRDEGLRPYHPQKVQALKPEDYAPRVEFSRWLLQQLAAQPGFSANVLFTDESTFTRDGICNTHNLHSWASRNPRDTRSHRYQERFSVNVWAGIVGDYLIGPYLMPVRLDAATYLIFLQQVLPELLQPVPANIQDRMWFQHDGAPPHFSLDVRRYLDFRFPGRWIGRGGPTPWPARSPDLSCLDFFLWGHLKSLVYESPIDSDEDLVARISVAAGTIRETPDMFENVRQSLYRRCNACITACGRSFEQFL